MRNPLARSLVGSDSYNLGDAAVAHCSWCDWKPGTVQRNYLYGSIQALVSDRLR